MLFRSGVPLIPAVESGVNSGAPSNGGSAIRALDVCAKPRAETTNKAAAIIAICRNVLTSARLLSSIFKQLFDLVLNIWKTCSLHQTLPLALTPVDGGTSKDQRGVGIRNKHHQD